MTIINVSSIKHFTAGSSDSLPTTGVPAGSIAMVFTTGTPNIMRRWYFHDGAWAREAVDGTT